MPLNDASVFLFLLRIYFVAQARAVLVEGIRDPEKEVIIAHQMEEI